MQRQEELNCDRVIEFSCQSYPFHLYFNEKSTVLRTILPYKISQSEISQLKQISHPNIINIKKIAKIRNSIIIDNNQQIYEIYYEAIMPDQCSWKNTAVQLQDLTNYLVKNKIYYPIKKKDIIFRKGSIKVFIPPAEILNLSSNKYTISDIEKAYSQMLWLIEKQNNLQHIQRVNKIDQQIQEIKSLINRQNLITTKNRQKYVEVHNSVHYLDPKSIRTKNKLFRSRQRTKTGQFLQQSVIKGSCSAQKINKYPILLKYSQIAALNKTSGEKIQQNINYINIYNGIQCCPNQSYPNLEQKKQKYKGGKQKINQLIENVSSIDSYEKQLEQRVQMPKLSIINYRHTVLPTSDNKIQKQINQDNSCINKRLSTDLVRTVLKSQLNNKDKKFNDQHSSVSSIKAKKNNEQIPFMLDQTFKFPDQNRLSTQYMKPKSNMKANCWTINQIQSKVNQAVNKTKAVLEVLYKAKKNCANKSIYGVK